MDGLSNNLLANGLLAGFYVVYKILDRCMHSKCRYAKETGFAFDLDGEDDQSDCPVNDMERIANLLKSRAGIYERKGTQRDV